VATEQDEKIQRLEEELKAQRVQAEKDREEMRELIRSIRKNVKEG
jgi:hypothetical protein